MIFNYDEEARENALQRAEVRRKLSLPSITQMIAAAAKIYSVTTESILGKTRKKRIVLARHWVMYNAVRIGRSSCAAVGQRLGKDHTSVLWGAVAHAARHDLPSVTTSTKARNRMPEYIGPEPSSDRPFYKASPDRRSTNGAHLNT